MSNASLLPTLPGCALPILGGLDRVVVDLIHMALVVHLIPHLMFPSNSYSRPTYGRILAWSQSKNRCRAARELRSSRGTIGSDRGISFLRLT